MAMLGRDSNQELEKTHGLVHGFTAVLEDFVYRSELVVDKDDYRAEALVMFGHVLADRLDDQCELNNRENKFNCGLLAE